MFDLLSEFRKLVAALDSNQIEYALCGGMAMAIYGRPRATVDIDMLLPSESLGDATATASELGYNIRGLDMSFAKGAIEIRRVSKIDAESGQVLSLDLLLVTPQIQEIWDARVKAEWQDGTLSVVSHNGLTMGQVDMSPAAVTARLKLVSELAKLCVSLQTAKIGPQQVNKKRNVRGDTAAQRENKK